MSKSLRETNPNSSTSLLIDPGAPFDFERSASMHGRFQKSLPDLYEDGAYKRVLHVSGKPVLVIVSSNGTTKRPRLRVEAHPRLSIPETKSLRNLLLTMFGRSFDFNSFRKVAKRDRLMDTVSRELVGLRPIAPPSIFEALVIAITEQQISLDAAIVIRSRLIEKYGDLMRFNGRGFYAFPTAMSLAKSKPTQMRAVGLSRSKVLYISELARKVESGELDLERFRMMDDESVVAELTKINGIGRWTAEYALVRGMGRVNSLPADDLGIQRAVSRAYFKGKRIGSKEVRRALTKFAPYGGIAAFYLMYYLFWRQETAA
jgi:DNA-3-methyladenine glycosylase II